MSVGNSGRIVIEIDPVFKQILYAQLDREGITLKEWFLRNASTYVEQSGCLPLFPTEQTSARETKK